LHGCLPPKSSRRKKIKENSEGMIFPENSYTGLAGRVFTWAQNTFLHKAQTNALCFVGMSMTDANIRRWLSWAFETYIEELRIAHAVKIEDIGGRHVWLQTKSQLSAEAIQMYPYALRHLGVQVCWLDNWDQIQSALKSLIGFR
jgi:hypothetical protein